MSKPHLRHFLKDKEARALLNEVSPGLRSALANVFSSETMFEVVEAMFGQVFLANSRPLLFKKGNRVYPTLLFREYFDVAPKVVVDMGAVPFVCKGADVMRPGIVRFDGDFKSGDCVYVVDVNHGKALVLGEAVLDKAVAESAKQGVVLRNIHFVGDKIWDFAKQLL